ncbi:hypothetical protein KY331_02230 [Candidatus Woesearchaeota archaeon]|nr:hypothetical protein [Candidatus Woesearchaeota archaeon]
MDKLEEKLQACKTKEEVMRELVDKIKYETTKDWKELLPFGKYLLQIELCREINSEINFGCECYQAPSALYENLTFVDIGYGKYGLPNTAGKLDTIEAKILQTLALFTGRRCGDGDIQARYDEFYSEEFIQKYPEIYIALAKKDVFFGETRQDLEKAKRKTAVGIIKAVAAGATNIDEKYRLAIEEKTRELFEFPKCILLSDSKKDKAMEEIFYSTINE